MTNEPLDELDADLGLDDYELLAPPPRSYDGWHLPRKQFIRHSQWSEPLRDILNARSNPLAPISYLGLPGADLLDLRHLHERLCEPTGRRLRFVGFDRAARPQEADNAILNTAFADMIRKPLVEDESRLFGDDLHLLLDEASVAFREVRRRAPFDVINLDFCEPVVGADLSSVSCVYPLLKRLFSLQRTNNPWLLLLTSRVKEEAFASSTLVSLLKVLEINRQQCDGFEALLPELLAGGRPLAEQDARSMEDGQFFRLVALLLGLWLISAAEDAHCKVSLVSAAGYAVYGGGGMDMLSLSIKVEPDYGLVANGVGRADRAKQECQQAKRMAPRISRPDSIDDYLAANIEWAHRATREAVALMESANHPLGPYLDWLVAKGIDITHVRAGSV
ncbi:hypothetical protein AB0G05_31285 [Nonomuraea wenchangensis]